MQQRGHVRTGLVPLTSGRLVVGLHFGPEFSDGVAGNRHIDEVVHVASGTRSLRPWRMSSGSGNIGLAPSFAHQSTKSSSDSHSQIFLKNGENIHGRWG